MYKAGVKMYKIIYMKADYEPWWKFDDFESKIVEVFEFETEEQFQVGVEKLLKEFRMNYSNEENREGKYYAFWNEEEKEYCDSCDEENQIYHGIIVEKME